LLGGTRDFRGLLAGSARAGSVSKLSANGAGPMR
jgi:hypothetical protein